MELQLLIYLIHKPYLIITTFVGSVPGLLIALLYGLSSNSLSESSDTTVIGTMTAAALVGALASVLTIHKKGSKFTLILGSTFFAVGSILIGVEPLTARAFYGVGAGLSYMTGPMFVSGFSPPQIKRALISVTGIFINVAATMLYVLNIKMSEVGGRLFSFFLPIFHIAVLLCLSETPVFLLKQGKIREAEIMLKRVCISIIDADRLYFSLTMELYEDQRSVFQSFKKYKKELFGGVITQLISQICGAQYVLYESGLVMEATGISRASQVWLLFFCMVVAFIIELVVVDQVGPKTLCMGSLLILVVSQVALGFLFGKSLTKELNLIIMIMLIMCNSVYGPGVGTAPMIIGVESFPINLEHFGGALVAVAKFVMNFIFILFIFDLALRLGPSTSFYIFGLSSLFGLVLVFLFVPTDKGQEARMPNHTGKMHPRHKSASCYF